MADKNCINIKLLEIMRKTGYPIVQHNGQRIYGPPPNWMGPCPPKGSEVFIGKLPRDIFEDELVPLFSKVGTIYELRLMMDFSGSNRGYAFVTYTTKAEATAAVCMLDGYEIRPKRNIGVVRSVDNRRLYIGNLPKYKTRDDVLQELTKRVEGITDVILYSNCYDRSQNRGFAFVEFMSHKAAAMARRALIPGCVKLWDRDLIVDWAEPEPDIDEDTMKLVKVLYVRNLHIQTTPDKIKSIFETAINDKIERVKKIYDYAFIHFYERAHAELAFAKLSNAEIDGCFIEIRWAKPVERDVYRIQKLTKGNAKFNNSNLDLTQTMMLYKQHLEKKEYDSSPKDEGIGSACAGDSLCCSPIEQSPPAAPPGDSFAPARLSSMCCRYRWSQPVYTYQKCYSPAGDIIVGCVELPCVGQPLFGEPRSVGPMYTRACCSIQQAHVEASEMALHTLKMLRADYIQKFIPPTLLYQPHQQQLMTPVGCGVAPNCASLPYFSAQICPRLSQPGQPITVPTIW
ncbi:unnamed protein product [Leptidea sinapis]|uniref:RRM domain-containing protein n=1 Tax=Leptidea sinapis TaxID=189913 RepID=A0A5E4Q736_9NEOP|nr:unnamed protein product [Leptidea sinapis]